MPEPLPAEPCKTLAEALAALQARLPRVAKTADAQYGKYADLTMVSDALLPVMSELGLSFTARPTLSGEARFVLLYSLLHVSGDELTGEYPLPSTGTPQQVGSAITYARRYTLCGGRAMIVWCVEERPPYEQGELIGIYATEELANEVKARGCYPDYIEVRAECVITELPSRESEEAAYRAMLEHAFGQMPPARPGK
jgi:hypothetical protein